MIEQLGAAIGVLFVISKVIGVVKSFIFVEESLKKISKRPASDKEAIITEHVFAKHRQPLRKCWQDTCSALG